MIAFCESLAVVDVVFDTERRYTIRRPVNPKHSCSCGVDVHKAVERAKKGGDGIYGYAVRYLSILASRSLAISASVEDGCSLMTLCKYSFALM